MYFILKTYRVNSAGTTAEQQYYFTDMKELVRTLNNCFRFFSWGAAQQYSNGAIVTYSQFVDALNCRIKIEITGDDTTRLFRQTQRCLAKYPALREDLDTIDTEAE